MNREKLIESLVQQFADKIKHAPDNTLKDLEAGKLTISLTPAVGKESGGAKLTYGGLGFGGGR